MRSFDANEYMAKKVEAINKFFKDNELDSVVIGVSGGIDSAVVLMLFSVASVLDGSPIKNIRAVIMPIFGVGTSTQTEATEKANALYNLNLPNTSWRRCDLTDSYESMVAQAYPDQPNAWASGQMASVLRTPMLYYQAALLQQDGFRSVVSGTTNRDEGSYIGFFGKASDGMVDVQPIGDIHKSEVYKLAEALGVPDVIVSDDPRGDVWDGKTDEEMIGAPYWFLQEYLENLGDPDWLSRGHDDLKIDRSTFDLYVDNIESLHRKNKHKYQVGSPAHFIDVMERCVPGGWN
jgi:NAD+ synthetase